MRKGRLLKIAKYLETTAQKREDRLAEEGKDPRFYLGVWNMKFTPKSCGYSACAIGWVLYAKLIPDFRWSDGSKGTGDPSYKDLVGWAAVEEVLDLTNKDATYLFSLYEYGYSPNPTEVAERIRKFVKGA